MEPLHENKRFTLLQQNAVSQLQALPKHDVALAVAKALKLDDDHDPSVSVMWVLFVGDVGDGERQRRALGDLVHERDSSTEEDTVLFVEIGFQLGAVDVAQALRMGKQFAQAGFPDRVMANMKVGFAQAGFPERSGTFSGRKAARRKTGVWLTGR